VQRAWPPEAAQRPFIEYLRSQYDATQLRAIEARLKIVNTSAVVLL
jgi:hypothetical protein